MSLREAKGQEIADRARIVQSGNLYLVPSQGSKKQYKVDCVFRPKVTARSAEVTTDSGK